MWLWLCEYESREPHGPAVGGPQVLGTLGREQGASLSQGLEPLWTPSPGDGPCLDIQPDPSVSSRLSCCGPLPSDAHGSLLHQWRPAWCWVLGAGRSPSFLQELLHANPGPPHCGRLCWAWKVILAEILAGYGDRFCLSGPVCPRAGLRSHGPGSAGGPGAKSLPRSASTLAKKPGTYVPPPLASKWDNARVPRGCHEDKKTQRNDPSGQDWTF